MFPFGIRPAPTAPPTLDDIARPPRTPAEPADRTPGEFDAARFRQSVRDALHSPLPPPVSAGDFVFSGGVTPGGVVVPLPGDLPSTAGARTLWSPEELRLLTRIAEDDAVTDAEAFVAEYEHATGKRRSADALADALQREGLETRRGLDPDAKLYKALRAMGASTLPTPPAGPPDPTSTRPRWTPAENAVLVGAISHAYEGVEAWRSVVIAEAAAKGFRERTPVAYGEQLRRLRNAGHIPAEHIPAATRIIAALKARKPVPAAADEEPAVASPVPAVGPVTTPPVILTPMTEPMAPVTAGPARIDLVDDLSAALTLYRRGLLDNAAMSRLLAALSASLA